MASNQAVKVDVVDNKKNKGKKLADKSIRAFVDVNKVKELIGGGGGSEALTINIGSTTYTYDGSEPVTITIFDGESMEF